MRPARSSQASIASKSGGGSASPGAVAAPAGAGRLVLTHLWPGTDPGQAVRAAAESYPGPIAVASPGLVAEVLGE